jgi:hypothetical protein
MKKGSRACERNTKTHFYHGDFSLTVEDMFQERMSLVCSSCGGDRKISKSQALNIFQYCESLKMFSKKY